MMLVEGCFLGRSLALVSLLLVLGVGSLAATQDPPLPNSERIFVSLPLPPVPPQSLSWIRSPDGLQGENSDAGGRDAPVGNPSPSAVELTSTLLGQPFPTVEFNESEVAGILTNPDDPLAANAAMRKPAEHQGTDWSNTGRQSFFFLGVMHGWRLALEPDTRAALRGPFFKDYWTSITQLRGWTDGDGFLTNYVGHPMMGAISGRILLQNQPASRDLIPGVNSPYIKSRLKAFGFATVFSLQFEVGLISEGTIGNKIPDQHSNHPFSYVDLVITPTLGTAWLIGEDLLDRYLVRQIETGTDSRVVRALARTFLTPTRSFSNLMRLKKPWHRDNRGL